MVAGSALALDKVIVGYNHMTRFPIRLQSIRNWNLEKYSRRVDREFQPALQGSIISNNLLAGKHHIGYMSVTCRQHCSYQTGTGKDEDGCKSGHV